MSISVGAVVVSPVSSTIILAAELIAACGNNYAVANRAWAHAKYENFQGWEVTDAAHAAMMAAGAELTAAVMAAGPEIGGRAWAYLARNDGQPAWGWLAADMASSTTPAQRRTMLRLAGAFGHDWSWCLESVWIDYGVAVWPSGNPRLPGGIGPCPFHTTATGRTRWQVQDDGSVTWEVWRGWRHLPETCEGIRDEAAPATPAGRAAMAEWCGMEFRTSPRPESAAPECVLRGWTSPEGEEVIEWRSHLCEERHEDATPVF